MKEEIKKNKVQHKVHEDIDDDQNTNHNKRTSLHTKLLTYIFKYIILDADRDCLVTIFWGKLCITRVDEYCSFLGVDIDL